MGTNSPVFDATLLHVIYNVLGMQHDGPFDKAIRTYMAQTITHLMCIPDEHIDGLYYLDDDGNETPLPSHSTKRPCTDSSMLCISLSKESPRWTQPRHWIATIGHH